MAPRIVGGSNYDNPYAKPIGVDPMTDKLFGGFNQPQQLSAQETRDDPIAEIQAEFREAQRRQRQPKPRKGNEPL